MPSWIALFRGINVGGRNPLPMKDLVRHLQSLELENVRTYIQSGNVFFRSSPDQTPAELAATIEARVEREYCFRPKVLILSADQLQKAIESNPFPDAESEPSTLHLFFLTAAPQGPDIESLTKARSAGERFHLTDSVFYLHAPEGMGRSKLALKVEKCLGVPVTARNWRTVQKLWEIVQAV